MPDEMMQLLKEMRRTDPEFRARAAEQSVERFKELSKLDDHMLLAMIAWLLERQTAMLADKLAVANVELNADQAAP